MPWHKYPMEALWSLDDHMQNGKIGMGKHIGDVVGDVDLEVGCRQQVKSRYLASAVAGRAEHGFLVQEVVLRSFRSPFNMHQLHFAYNSKLPGGFCNVLLGAYGAVAVAYHGM